MATPGGLLRKFVSRLSRWFSGFRLLVMIGLLLVDLAILGMAALSLKASRDYAFNQATMLVDDVAKLEERAISGLIAGANTTLVDAAEHIEEYLADGGDSWSIDRLLAVRLRFQPDLDALRFADRAGHLVFGTGVGSAMATDVADRDFFLRAKADPNAGLIISRPFVGRLTGRRIIALARRVNGPDGAFAGVVYAVIPMARLEEALSPLRLGRDGVIALADLDLNVLIRQTNLERGTPDIGQQVGRSPDFFRAWNRDPAAGTYRVRNSFDDIDRVMAYRKLTSYPGYVFVGLAERDLLGEWHKELARILVLTVLVIAATVAIAWLSWVSRRRLERLNADLQRLALTDELTGCANRRSFLDLLEAERGRCQRTGAPFCLLALDIDHFKAINDRHGHAAGDRALSHFAKCVRGVLRTGDRLGRLGGEEFAVLLPDAGLAAALAIAERIRSAVESGPLIEAGRPLPFTVSIGAAEWRGADSVETLLLRADAALYAAKAAGRNSVQQEHAATAGPPLADPSLS